MATLSERQKCWKAKKDTPITAADYEEVDIDFSAINSETLSVAGKILEGMPQERPVQRRMVSGVAGEAATIHPCLDSHSKHGIQQEASRLRRPHQGSGSVVNITAKTGGTRILREVPGFFERKGHHRVQQGSPRRGRGRGRRQGWIPMRSYAGSSIRSRTTWCSWPGGVTTTRSSGTWSAEWMRKAEIEAKQKAKTKSW